MTSPHYMPILKGRMGEFRALKELGQSNQRALTPIVEIPLGPTDSDSEDPAQPSVTADPSKFSEDLAKHLGDRRFIFDASQAPPPASGSAATATVDVLGSLMERMCNPIPTVRPSDASEDIEALREALSVWRLNSVCVRLAGDDLDDNDRPLSESLDDLLTLLQIEPANIDLVIDFGALSDEQSVSFAARIARLVIGELPHIDRWGTLTVSSGGFPADLNGVQPEVLTEITRYDAALWRAIRDRLRARQPGFGDYAVGYAAQTAGVGFAPAPQLRFTFGESWLIYKGRKRDRRGSAQFYDICSRMVGRGAVDPDLSWGDRYVDDAAGGPDNGRGPGNPMIWRAIGTSHHMNYVVSRLATRGEP